jgi:hypothetical protein
MKLKMKKKKLKKLKNPLPPTMNPPQLAKPRRARLRFMNEKLESCLIINNS